VFSVDWGVVFGLTGVGVGMLSLIYARTQALNARRQADAAHLSTRLDIQRAMADRAYQAQMEMLRNTKAAQMYFDANPSMREVYEDGDAFEVGVFIRNMIDGFQDMYFLRKRGIVDDHHWCNWVAVFLPIARMPLTRRIYDNAVNRMAIDAEFAEFLKPVFAEQSLRDPRVGSS
jgi:hypothetical protein